MSGQGFSRSSFSATASRINAARPYVPTSASTLPTVSGGKRTGTIFMLSGGLPIGRAVARECVSGKKTMPFSVDAINDADYINGIVYGGKTVMVRNTKARSVADQARAVAMSAVKAWAQDRSAANEAAMNAANDAWERADERAADAEDRAEAMQDRCDAKVEAEASQVMWWVAAKSNARVSA